MMRPVPVRNGGFTYLTLLLAIAIMWVTMSTAAEVWHTAVQREKEQELLFVGDQFRNAIRLYYLEHARAYPSTLEDLLTDTRQPATRRYLRRIYRDPMTGGNEWGLVRRADGGIMGVHSLSEMHPIKIAGFNMVNSSFEGAEKYSDWIFVAQSRLPPRARKTDRTISFEREE